MIDFKIYTWLDLFFIRKDEDNINKYELDLKKIKSSIPRLISKVSDEVNE